MSTHNSITQFFDEVVRMQDNAINVVSALNNVATSSADSINVPLEDSKGVKKTYTLTTLSKTQSEIKRIDANFNSILSQNGTPVSVRMSDGSYKKIFQQNLYKEPKALTGIAVPGNFYQKNNFFLDNFLNPSMYVAFDVTSQVSDNTRKVQVKRVIFDSNNSVNVTYFDANLKNKNDFSYDSLVSQINANGLTYFIDDNIVDLPVSVARFSGSFDIVSYRDEVVNSIGTNGETLQQNVRKYRLNTLKYTDNLANIKNSETLKIGDSLDFGTSSTYKVTMIDSSTNSIVVEMTSGTEALTIGIGVLSLSITTHSKKEIQLNIGFGERQAIFLKPIDNDTNLAANEFSNGVAFFSNELTIVLNNGTFTLADFYKNDVVDLGKSLLSQSKENIIPAILAEKPSTPTLNSNDLSVDIINTHLLSSKSVSDIKNKISQKNDLSTELAQIDNTISVKRKELNTTKFNNDTEKEAVQAQLNSLIANRNTTNNLYTSVVKDLSSTATNLPPELTNPKYAIRGFFPIPTAASSVNTTDQHIIQFIVSYRYLSLDNTSSDTRQYNFTGNDGSTIRGYFSNWIEFKTDIRKKKYDSETGTYIWLDENVESPDSNNINQLNIPISPGEKVEIRIKSVSEAGWPLNPQTSEWSNSIIMPFPDSLSKQQDIITSLINTTNDEVKITFNADLSSRGLDQHLNSSFVVKDKYFAHTAFDVSSGFFNTDGSIISLGDKLKELDNTIATINASIQQQLGVLSVYLKDDTGNITNISNNSILNVFGGYYVDELAKITSGTIITKAYTLVLENSGSTAIQLASRYPGGLDSLMVPATDASFDMDLKNRFYENALISISNLDADDAQSGKFVAPYGSRQYKSQFIYARGTDIGLVNKIFDSNSDSQSIDSQKGYDGHPVPPAQFSKIPLGFDDMAVTQVSGAYLYMSIPSYDAILTDGRDYLGSKTLNPGASNSISIPIIFEYVLDASKTSISKKLGLDILARNNTIFSFDIKAVAKYKSDTQSQVSTNIIKNTSITKQTTNI